MMYQEFGSQLDWDDPLPERKRDMLVELIQEVAELGSLPLTRFVNSNLNDTTEIHIFADASKHAYGACVFVRTVVDSKVQCTLLTARARVMLLKPITMPQLE